MDPLLLLLSQVGAAKAGVVISTVVLLIITNNLNSGVLQHLPQGVATVYLSAFVMVACYLQGSTLSYSPLVCAYEPFSYSCSQFECFIERDRLLKV